MKSSMTSHVHATDYPCLMGWYPPSATKPSTIALFWDAHNGVTVYGASGIGVLVNDGPLAERGEWREWRGEVTVVNS